MNHVRLGAVLAFVAGVCGAARAGEHAVGANKVSCPRKFPSSFRRARMSTRGLRGSGGELFSGRVRGRHISNAELNDIVDEFWPQYRARVRLHRGDEAADTVEGLFRLSDDTDRYLVLRAGSGAEGVTAHASDIMLHSQRTRSAVFEELVHAEHHTIRGLGAGGKAMPKHEAVAVSVVIRGAKKWRIPAEEVDDLKKVLKHWTGGLDAQDMSEVAEDVKALATRLGL